ncbi:PAS domain-containing protein [Chitinophaga solisilvae]|uniref:histidine kinase n=1 Tax=Chitinophaga solisilvae TaxID=1233460 RepID=A0A9Q5DCG7_9BACT|nr:PAS domain-containing protein [Chitinophaga solisilvae]NSL89027.1 PAS domain-containing protein [Chitinophaga solisilvae]
MCLLFLVIVINAYLIIGNEFSIVKTGLIACEIVTGIVFLLLSITLLQKNYHFIQYERLFSQHPVPMWIYDKKTLHFLSVNQAACDKYGYTRQEFLQLTLADIREKEEVEALMENIRDRCNGVEYRGIWKHRKKNGINFFVEIYAHSTSYYGRPARFIMAKDVDEQVKVAREAHQLGVRYELLAQATNDAVYDRNLLSNTVSWNHGLASLFRHSPEEETDIFDWWKNNIHPADCPQVMTSLEQCFTHNRNYWSEQYRFLCADGCYKYVVDRAFIMYSNNTPMRMIGMMQDIDKHVKQAMRLEEQNKTLREIAWINSHEIRQPVVSILGITRLFDTSNQDIHLNSRLMEWLHQSTQQLDDIIHKIEHKTKEIQ